MPIQKVIRMDKAYYDAQSLARALSTFEERFGLSSEKFYEAYVSDGEGLAGIPGFQQRVWASFHRDARCLGGDDFVEAVERTLQLA